ncbi:DDE-type integrase/transposase/recombinase [Propionibacteriaceae bacterium Y1685]
MPRAESARRHDRFTYVATWSGTVYVAFIVDVYSRRIVVWRCATSMSTELVLDTREHAVWTRKQAGVIDLIEGLRTFRGGSADPVNTPSGMDGIQLVQM